MSKKVFYLEDFNYDNEIEKIASCPQGNICIESKFILSKRYYYARFKSEQCIDCNFTEQCPIKIKGKNSIARIFKKPKSSRNETLQEETRYKNCLIDKSLEKILKAHVEVEEMDYVDILMQGTTLKHQGRYEESKEKCIQAIHVDNTHPNGFYNLGKILYILKDYKASAKAYKASYERGICELQATMPIMINPNNVFIHLGHSLLDETWKNSKYKDIILEYREGIDPNRLTLKKHIENDLRYEYEQMCIEAAKEYLEKEN